MHACTGNTAFLICVWVWIRVFPMLKLIVFVTFFGVRKLKVYLTRKGLHITSELDPVSPN